MSIRDEAVFTAYPGKGWKRKAILAVLLLLFGLVLALGIQASDGGPAAPRPTPTPQDEGR